MKWTHTLALLLAALLLAGCNLPGNPTPLPTAGTPGIPVAGQTPGAPAATLPASSTAPASGEVMIMTRDETNARTGPGLDFPASHLLPAGLTLRPLGRSADNAWLVISAPAEELEQPALWVAAEVVDLRGDVSLLPVTAGPALPTQGPTRQASPSPVRTLAP